MKILKKISTVLLLSCAVACPADAAKVVDEYGRITLATNTTRKMSSADRLILASSVE